MSFSFNWTKQPYGSPRSPLWSDSIPKRSELMGPQSRHKVWDWKSGRTSFHCACVSWPRTLLYLVGKPPCAVASASKSLAFICDWCLLLKPISLFKSVDAFQLGESVFVEEGQWRKKPDILTAGFLSYLQVRMICSPFPKVAYSFFMIENCPWNTFVLISCDTRGAAPLNVTQYSPQRFRTCLLPYPWRKKCLLPGAFS